MLTYFSGLYEKIPFMLATLFIWTELCVHEDAGEAVSVTRRLSRLG